MINFSLLLVASAFLFIIVNSQAYNHSSFTPTDETWNSLIPGPIKQVDLSAIKERLLMFARDTSGEFCVPYSSYPGRRESREPLSLQGWLCEHVHVSYNTTFADH